MGHRELPQDNQGLPRQDDIQGLHRPVFYFGFAVLLYNMWLLVDFIVQISLDIKYRYKPRVTAKRFLNLARKQLSEPGLDSPPTQFAPTERSITTLFSRSLLS